ncbi:MAG: molybdate ABC transporter substrate-binding protein [Gammaproteobacteria bacterium]
MRTCFRPLLVAAALLGGASAHAGADSATVAVAANFLAPLEALQRTFEQTGTHKLSVVSGSTGQLYAQITNGAPFDVMLSADQETIAKLVAHGRGDGSMRFTYAVGTLVLFTREPRKFAPLNLDALRSQNFRWLAIANPDLAPYGLAAQQTLQALGLWDTLQPRLVRGQSIAQTFAQAETRNADLAFVAMSQAIAYGDPTAYFPVPEELHAPLRQDAVLLAHGRENVAAREFLKFLRSAPAARTISDFGYRPGAP